VFMLGLGIFSVVGMFVRVWLGYDLEMRQHEAEMVGLRPRTGDAPDRDDT